MSRKNWHYIKLQYEVYRQGDQRYVLATFSTLSHAQKYRGEMRAKLGLDMGQRN